MLARSSRTGWLGIPLGLIAALATLLLVFNEYAAFLVGLLVAGAGGARLPYPDRLAAVGVGIIAAWLLMWVIPQGGADSPLSLFAAACSASFAVGALLSALLAALRAPRPG